jgi:hypothetical protein
MKTKILFSMFLFFTFISTTIAHVWRVNNNPGISADFATFLAAHAAASNYDTLYIEGSSASYGNITITKPLVIIGTGFFLEQNPQTQANPISSKFGSITFANGSSGSTITGLDISLTVTVTVGEINITHCYIRDTGIYLNCTSSAFGNIFINANYIYANYYMDSEAIHGVSSSNQVYNLVISNNFLSPDASENSISLGTNYSGVLSNNILKNGFNISNFTVTNNILRSGTVTQNNNVYFNNIGNGTQFPTGNGNQQNINMTDVFIGLTGNSTDGQWQLITGSPAIGAGNDGTDCGMFGGATPYVLSGLPGIPAIYEINMPSAGTSTDGINVTVKAKTH